MPLLEATSRYSFKAEDRLLEFSDPLDICPAPFLARARWLQIDPAACQLRDEALICLIEEFPQQVLQ